MLTALAGIIYEEIAGSKVYKTSWSAIFAWFGFVANIVTCFVTCVLYCVPPSARDGGSIDISPGRSDDYNFQINDNNTITHKFYDDINIDNLAIRNDINNPNYEFYDDDVDIDNFSIAENNRARYIGCGVTKSSLQSHDLFILGYNNTACDDIG